MNTDHVGGKGGLAEVENALVIALEGQRVVAVRGRHEESPKPRDEVVGLAARTVVGRSGEIESLRAVIGFRRVPQ